MSYHIYNTPGFILAATPAGEASRYVYIFTRELGLVGAHAQNTRHVSSKLRYSLDAPARSVVSLVRGRNMWRLTSAVPEKRFAGIFASDPEKLQLCTRVFSLLKKLLAGEEANEPLFTILAEFLNFLEENFNNDVSKTIDLKNAETILLLRVLHLLGYVPENELTKRFAIGQEWSAEILSAMNPQRKEAVAIINESLKETGL